MRLDEINALDREAFTVRLGGIAEGSPWVAYGAYDFAPFADALELVAGFRGAVAREGEGRQVALVAAHGDSPSLPGLQPADADAYRERFGFPFVLGPGVHDPAAVATALAARLANDRDLELAIALDEVVKVMRARVAELLGQ